METKVKIKTKDGIVVEKTSDENNYDKFIKDLHNLVENKPALEVYEEIEEVVVNVTFGK